ncbi:hypothetical protein C1645_835304 [Glomus cerebriforme]|uniref:Uncharacterized protein n=1 Tax=Glomus cerebriforme TaxID=658196 RepID=A0A397S942_9GLOM|nr:hypothetical protein C1645_835304 [Glomus cerebriforme]
MAKTLAENLKWYIILLYNNEYTKKQIANLLYIGEILIKKIIRIYAKWGCVVNPWKLVPSGTGDILYHTFSEQSVIIIFYFSRLFPFQDIFQVFTSITRQLQSAYFENSRSDSET